MCNLYLARFRCLSRTPLGCSLDSLKNFVVFFVTEVFPARIAHDAFIVAVQFTTNRTSALFMNCNADLKPSGQLNQLHVLCTVLARIDENWINCALCARRQTIVKRLWQEASFNSVEGPHIPDDVPQHRRSVVLRGLIIDELGQV